MHTRAALPGCPACLPVRAYFEKPQAPPGRFFVAKRRKDRSFGFAWHHHDEFELTLITSSSGRRFVGDHIEAYGDGDLVLLGPHLPHAWSSASRGPGIWHEAVVVQFSPAMLGAGRLLDPALGEVQRLLSRSRHGLKFVGHAAGDIAARLRRLPDLASLPQLAELLLILQALAEARGRVALSTRTFEPESAPGADHPVSRVCAYINRRVLDPELALPEVARFAGMSPSTLTRFLQRSIGRSFTDYVVELRLAHACRLLLETERSVAGIADAAGFANQSNFNRRFLRAKGMRPREFRRAFREAALRGK